jgi:hypothetical protein
MREKSEIPKGAVMQESKAHLEMVGETYGQHATFALRFSARLFVASVAVFVHALVPAWFMMTGSRTVKQLSDELSLR